MKKKIILTEAQFKKVLHYKILNEYGQKGKWKAEWSEQDQLLAMYNHLYGIEDLGINKAELMDKIIGSSIGALNQQTANFRSLYTDRREGLHRESNPQNAVFEKYKNLSRQELKKICLDIIQERLENPDIAVTKKKLGQEIGDKRDEIAAGRKEGLIKAGIDPKKVGTMKLIGSKLLNPPAPDDDEDIVSKPGPEGMKRTEKEQIQDYLKSIHDRLKNAVSKEDTAALADELEFVMDYIDSELTDKEEGMMAESIKRIKEITKKINSF